MSTYVGRQPIFDKEGVCFGYELLYRSCEINNVATFQDNAKATARVIVNLIHNIGLTPIIGHKMGYINVDETMLFSDAVLLLPKEYFGFEILEHTKVSLALYERVKYLHSLGYRFSLDDFDCSDLIIQHYEPLFPYTEMIKVDIQAIGIPQLEAAIHKLKKYNIPLLAEKIETHEEYEVCTKLDFLFFQGYFFEKPIILSGQKIEPNTINAIRLINCIQENNDVTYISNKFATCPDLVYNLLRHVNSGAYHFKQKITSIKQMVTLLGPQKILSWLGLFLYGEPHHRPFGDELFNNVKFRAKTMEELALACNKAELANKAFLTGSLSLIDAYLNISMEEFLANVHLDDEIKKALLTHEGFLGELLYIATQMNHSCDMETTIKALGHYPCFNAEQLYDACMNATLFVEETEHTKET
ncbi:EAL and HDOD domain-containing protein [Sulfurospirillum oryzae]|uniref:EAL and HDOD domain-containing protein n=1 Tax=Sulfurospirillum oryzae TaxID=2976535 RepID=UPI0021E8C9A3|nr:EAL domain-containing protein [Sulfurospirillum oryzae]